MLKAPMSRSQGSGPAINRRSLLLAVSLPVVLTSLLLLLDNPWDVFPGSLLLAVTSVVAWRSGIRAGGISLASSFVCFAILTYLAPMEESDAGDDLILRSLLLLLFSGLIIAAIVSNLRAKLRAEQVAGENALALRNAEVLLAVSPLATGLIDRSGRLTAANPRLAALTGYPMDSHPGHLIADIWPALARELDLLRAVAEGPQIGEASKEIRVTEATGRVRHFSVFVSRGSGAEPGSGSIAFSLLDITDEALARRRAEITSACAEELSRVTCREELYDAVLSAIPGPVEADSASVLEVEPGTRSLLVARTWGRVEEPYAPGTRISMGEGDPVSEAVRTGRLVSVCEEARCEAALPAIDFRLGREVLAALVLRWRLPHNLNQPDRLMLRTLSVQLSDAISRIEEAERSKQDSVELALSAMLDKVIIGSAVRDSHGEILRFRIEWTNDPGAGQLRLTPDEYPLQFALLCRVLRSGEPYENDAYRTVEAGLDGQPLERWWSLRIAPSDGDGFVCNYREITGTVRAEVELQESRNRLASEHALVERLQAIILPRALPTVPGYSISAAYRPAGQTAAVGGDWYDCFLLRDGRIGVVVGDVAGSGLAAASAMAELRFSLRAYAWNCSQPSDVLRRVSENLSAQGSKTFATCLYVMLTPSDGTVTWSSAGHLPPLLRKRDGSAQLLASPPNPPLGPWHPDSGALEEVATLAPGDELLLYTDGLVERRGRTLDEGLSQLVAAAQAVRVGGAVGLDALMERLDGGGRLTDDRCVISILRTVASG